MFGSTILEVAIGVVFVYLVLSLISSAINEAISTLLNKRGKNLFEGIKNLLNDPQFTGLAQQLYYHGLVDGISQNASKVNTPNRLPSYMPSSVFSLALMDILRAKGSLPPDAPANNADPREADPPTKPTQANALPSGWLNHLKNRFYLRNGWIPSGTTMDLNLQSALDKGRELASSSSIEAANALDAITNAVRQLPPGHTKESLFVLIDKTKRDVGMIRDREIKAADYLDQFQKNVEQWFEEAMQRVSGWYKRWTQTVLFMIGLCLVFVTNADTLTLVQRFTHDSTLRAAVVAAAENAAQHPAPATSTGTAPTNTAMLPPPVSAVTAPDNAAQPSAPTAGPEGNPLQQGSATSQTSKTGNPAIDQLLQTANDLNLPLGWQRDSSNPLPFNPLWKLFGLLITTIAISLGAPFWFDTLSKLVNLRGAGTPPGETQKSAPQPNTTQTKS